MNLEVWRLEPTWPNVEMLLHRLWGRAKDRDYSPEEKHEWGALASMLSELRYERSER